MTLSDEQRRKLGQVYRYLAELAKQKEKAPTLQVDDRYVRANDQIAATK